MKITIPGMDDFEATDLVMDFNGTLAIEGQLIEGVRTRLIELSSLLRLHVVTADTFGMAADELKGLPVRIHILSPDQQSRQKAEYITEIGTPGTICIGNGRNDTEMLQICRLGIALIQAEGAAWDAISAADLVFSSVTDAFDTLLNLKRLQASLRI